MLRIGYSIGSTLNSSNLYQRTILVRFIQVLYCTVDDETTLDLQWKRLRIRWSRHTFSKSIVSKIGIITVPSTAWPPPSCLARTHQQLLAAQQFPSLHEFWQSIGPTEINCLLPSAGFSDPNRNKIEPLLGMYLIEVNFRRFILSRFGLL